MDRFNAVAIFAQEKTAKSLCRVSSNLDFPFSWISQRNTNNLRCNSSEPDVRRAHLREHPVQPLEWPVEVDLDPAGRRRDGLPAVLRAPTLDETHPDGAHPRQLVHRLEALVHRLREELGELLVVEDLQVATGRDLANLTTTVKYNRI